MDKTTQRAAAKAWRDRPPKVGIYAVTAPAEGIIWVGATRTLDSVERRLRFEMRLGGARPPALQAAFNRLGGEGLAFETLEKLDEDLSPMARDRILKDRLAYWLDAKKAEAL